MEKKLNEKKKIQIKIREKSFLQRFSKYIKKKKNLNIHKKIEENKLKKKKIEKKKLKKKLKKKKIKSTKKE